MKRSEMLNIIIDKIEEHLVNIEHPENLSLYIGDEILTVLENAGMLPPGHNPKYKIDGQEYLGHYMINTWEKE